MKKVLLNLQTVLTCMSAFIYICSLVFACILLNSDQNVKPVCYIILPSCLFLYIDFFITLCNFLITVVTEKSLCFLLPPFSFPSAEALSTQKHRPQRNPLRNGALLSLGTSFYFSSGRFSSSVPSSTNLPFSIIEILLPSSQSTSILPSSSYGIVISVWHPR